MLAYAVASSSPYSAPVKTAVGIADWSLKRSTPSPTITTWTSPAAASDVSRSTCFSGASRPTKPTIGLPPARRVAAGPRRGPTARNRSCQRRAPSDGPAEYREQQAIPSLLWMAPGCGRPGDADGGTTPRPPAPSCRSRSWPRSRGRRSDTPRRSAPRDDVPPSPRPSRAGRATPNARRRARIRAAPAKSVASGAPTAGWSPSGTSRTAPGAPGYRHRYGPRAPRHAGYRAR